MGDYWPLDQLEDLKKRGLFRTLTDTRPAGHGKVRIGNDLFIDLSSNDYLGLSHHPFLKRAAHDAIEQYGLGARASRLMSGNLDLYGKLEGALAHLKSTETGLVFGSGYLCNLAVMSALAGPEDCIILDRLCHASIVDGALLSRARIKRFRHNSTDHLVQLLERSYKKYKRILVVAESVYSMDGDLCPVGQLVKITKNFSAVLVVDEAHAVGVFGKHGEGLVEKDSSQKPDMVIGTFGKALGGYGAFCCCAKGIRDYLVNKARGLIYSTGLPPSVLASNLSALDLLPELEGERKRLLSMASNLRRFIKDDLGLKTLGSSQIVPLLIGDVKRTLELERHLFNQGIWAKAIRPPTVPEGSARIRFSLSASHGEEVLSILKESLLTFFKG